MDQPELVLALRGDALEDVAVGREVVVVSDDDVAARRGTEHGGGQLVQVDGDGVADQDLSSGRTHEVLGQHVAGFGWQPNPLVPGPDEAYAPVLVHHLGDARLRAHRQRAKRVPVQVDQVPVLLDESVTEGRELISAVQSLGI